MDYITIDYHAWISVKKDDISISNALTDEKVDVSDYSAKEIVEGIENGIFVLNLKEIQSNAVVVNENYTVDVE